MTKAENSVYLKYILDAIHQIEEYAYGISYEDFCQNRMIQDAIFKQLENIGEASRNLTKDFQTQHSKIPWSKIIGMRNMITHQYFAIELMTVWDTVKMDIPLLKDWISFILKKEK